MSSSASAWGPPSRLLPLALLLAVLAAGCAATAPISPALKTQAQPVKFEELQANPEQFQGETVILGGQIIDATPTPEGTQVTVLQTKTEDAERPEGADTSLGRFIALYKGFLDPQIYAKGRQVTVAGKVAGKRMEKLGQVDYAYPLIRAEQVYLWPRPQPAYYAPYYYPWGPYWGPYGFYGPWWWW
jgi:outer membrane lipoprotein